MAEGRYGVDFIFIDNFQDCLSRGCGNFFSVYGYFDFIVFHFVSNPPGQLYLLYGIETAGVEAVPAFDADFHVYGVRFL